MSELTYSEINEQGKVNCQICGKPYLVISPTHLHNKHNVTLEQYRIRFPNVSISSKEFRIRGLRGRSGLFKEKLKEKMETVDEIRDDDLPDEKPQAPTGPVVEEIISYDTNKKPQTPIDSPVIEDINLSDIDKSEPPMDPITRKKQEILYFLKGTLPNTQENYLISKKSLTGHLRYEYITDFADPVLKIDFEFPDTFWHNRDIYQDLKRVSKLESDGWKVVEVPGNNPTIEMLEKIIKSF